MPFNLLFFGGAEQAAPVDPIVSWQAAGNVVIAGLESSRWVENAKSNETVFTLLQKLGCRFSGTITSARIDVGARNGATWKIKVFRYTTGNNFTFVSSTSFVPAATGQQLITGLNIPVQKGDSIAIYYPTTGNSIWNGNGAADGNYFHFTSADTLASGDIGGSVAGFANAQLAEYFSTRPYLATCGDSITEGAVKYNSFFPSFSVGDSKCKPGPITTAADINYSIDYNVEQIKSGLKAVNCARGGQTFAWGVSTGVPRAILLDPKYIICAFGINDINTGRTWAQVEADLNSILALVTGRTLLVSEILPSTFYNDTIAAQIRLWNGNLATWCTANSITLMATHDAMGQTRASTGQLDDLKAAYNYGDGTHLNPTGSLALGTVWAGYIT